MKYNLFVLSLFSILFVTANHAIAAPLCHDTDGGHEPLVYGQITNSFETVADVCLVADPILGVSKWNESTSGTHLQEGSCTDNFSDSLTLNVVECAGGCQNGTCLPVVIPTIIPTSTPVISPSPAPTAIYSTGKKVESTGKISLVESNYIKVGTVKVIITPDTIIKLNYKTLTVGQRAYYKGIKNSDNSVTAVLIELR